MDKYKCRVVSQDLLAEGIFSLWIDAPQLVKDAHSGQFVSVFITDPSRILPRPISICDLDKENGLYKFKKGFCDKEEVREYIGEIDMVYSKIFFFAYDKILPFMQSFKRKVFKLFKR